MRIAIWRVMSQLRVALHCLWAGRFDLRKHRITEQYSAHSCKSGVAETWIIGCSCGGCVRYRSTLTRKR